MCNSSPNLPREYCTNPVGHVGFEYSAQRKPERFPLKVTGFLGEIEAMCFLLSDGRWVDDLGKALCLQGEIDHAAGRLNNVERQRLGITRAMPQLTYDPNHLDLTE